MYPTMRWVLDACDPVSCSRERRQRTEHFWVGWELRVDGLGVDAEGR